MNSEYQTLIKVNFTKKLSGIYHQNVEQLVPSCLKCHNIHTQLTHVKGPRRVQG